MWDVCCALVRVWGKKMMEIYRETKWLRFMVTEKKPKTVVMDVRNRAGELLGQIKWNRPWRQYVYYSLGIDAQFNNGCLQDIADVLSNLNKDHKEK